MDNKAFATEIYEFLSANDALGHLGDIRTDAVIAEIEGFLSDPQMVADTIRDIEDISDTFDDHQFYITDVKPLLNGLNEIKGQLEAEQHRLEVEQRRRMVADTGFEVQNAIQMGDREILMAVNLKDPDGNFYMKAEYTENGIIGQYDLIVYSPSYLCIMEEFAGALERQINAVRKELVNFDPRPITPEQCYPHDYSQSIDGMVVAIKAEVLRPEYQRGDVQLVFVRGGNGSRANARGSAVFCYHLNNGEHTRFERHQVMGVIKELPDWARKQLAAVKAQIAAEHTKSVKDRGDAR